MNIFNIYKQPGDDNDLQEINLIEELVFERSEELLLGCSYLFKYCPDQIFRRCISDNEVSVIKLCHSEACGSHFS
jgi:hypothetical protein